MVPPLRGRLRLRHESPHRREQGHRADLLHGEETVVYADAGYQGIEKRDEMEGKGIGFRVAMRPGKHRALPDTPEGRVDDLIETAKAHIRAKVEHPFRVM